MGTMGGRRGAALAVAVAAVLLLAGCTANGVGGDLPTPSSTRTLSAAARRAIDQARLQAAEANSPTAPPTILPDTIETWPAVDHGAEPHADGSATATAPGVFRYTVAPDDGYDAIATRFGLCLVDITDDGAGGELQPGATLVLQRHDDDPDAHTERTCDPGY